MTSSNWINVSVICEGKTELFLVKYVLNPYFNSSNIKLVPFDLGGNVSIDKTVRYINRTKPGIVTSLVDYYGLKKSTNKTADEILKEIKLKSLREHTIPYVQMYEIEALLFSDIDKIALKMNASNKQKEELQKIDREFNTPEDINNSFDTAPSKRLAKIFIGYDKPRDGEIIAKEIGIYTILEKCPKFKKWTEDIIEKANQIRGL